MAACGSDSALLVSRRRLKIVEATVLNCPGQMVTRYTHPTGKHQFESIKRMEAFRMELEASKKKKCG